MKEKYVIPSDISSHVIQIEIENNVSDSFNKHLDKLMYRFISHQSTNSKEIAKVYEKLSGEYIKKITNVK